MALDSLVQCIVCCNICKSFRLYTILIHLLLHIYCETVHVDANKTPAHAHEQGEGGGRILGHTLQNRRFEHVFTIQLIAN